MFSITRTQTSDEWILPEEVFVLCMMKRNKRSIRASNLVFTTEKILEPYEAFKQTLDGGARKRTFPKPEGVDEITHLVLCDTYRSAAKLKNHRVGRKTLQDMDKYGYKVAETEKTDATMLPTVIPWTISNKTLFNKWKPEPVDVEPAPPAKKARVYTEEEKERMHDEMYKKFGARVRLDFL